MKAIDDLVRQPGAWLDVSGGAGAVVSSRVRLARNIDRRPFPGWAGEEESLRVWNEMTTLLAGLPALTSNLVAEMPSLTRVDREVLVERHIISRELAEKNAGSGVVFRRDESISVMVNEEDHLRIQAMRPGLDLEGLWRTVDALDTEIERSVNYAFSPRLGYLTACPTNVGTGIRASVMMHLPGLVLMNEIGPVIKGIGKIGLAVRGLWGEGTEAAGNMFQLSNQTTLGEKEETLISRLAQIVTEVGEHEANARARMMQQKEASLRNHIGRAYGILMHAYMLSSKETLDMLSALRLGVEMELLGDWKVADVNALFLSVQPGHLQKAGGKAMGSDKRDFARARTVRERLAAIGSGRGGK